MHSSFCHSTKINNEFLNAFRLLAEVLVWSVCVVVKEVFLLSVTVEWTRVRVKRLSYHQVSLWLVKETSPHYNSNRQLPSWWRPPHVHRCFSEPPSLSLSITSHLMNGWQPFSKRPSGPTDALSVLTTQVLENKFAPFYTRLKAGTCSCPHLRCNTY